MVVLAETETKDVHQVWHIIGLFLAFIEAVKLILTSSVNY